MQDRMDMAGRLTIRLLDRAGVVRLERAHSNRIVAGGRRLVAEMFAGQAGGAPRTPISAIGVGTGNAGAADADIALAAQRDRVAISKVAYSAITDPATNAARVQVQLTALLDYGIANDPAVPLREAGLFNADGVLYSRVVFKDVTKTDMFQLTAQWVVIF